MQTLKLLIPLIRSLIIMIAVAYILSLVLPGCAMMQRGEGCPHKDISTKKFKA